MGFGAVFCNFGTPPCGLGGDSQRRRRSETARGRRGSCSRHNISRVSPFPGAELIFSNAYAAISRPIQTVETRRALWPRSPGKRGRRARCVVLSAPVAEPSAFSPGQGIGFGLRDLYLFFYCLW